MKDLEDWAAVHRVYNQTKSKRKTAKILGISRNTVKTLLEMTEAPKYHRLVYHSKIDPYREQIIEWRCDPYDFNGTRIFRELKSRGYEGSIGPVYRFLKKIDEDIGDSISKKATVRHESPPGDQAQFDWSEYKIIIGNSYRTVYCFSLVLAASRKKAICFSLREDADAIYEAIQDLFDELGGVTLELLIDNPKALVIDNNPKNEEEIKYNPHALLMAANLGTELNACPCYWPRKKGKVENPFTYIEQQFIKGNKFESMEELNRHGKQFVNDWCNEVHGTTRRVPNDYFLLEEKALLQPVPKKHYYQKNMVTRTISPDSYLSFEGNKYSVPVKYATKKVKVRMVYGYKIKVYDEKDNFIIDIEAFDSKHNTRTTEAHYDAIAKKVPTSIPQIRRDFTARFSNGLRYLEAAGKKFDQPTHYARKIMELQELYDDKVLDEFIGLSIEENKMDIKSFRSMLREYNSGKRKLKKPVEQEKTIENQTDASLIRDCSYYEDCGKENIHADNG